MSWKSTRSRVTRPAWRGFLALVVAAAALLAPGSGRVLAQETDYAAEARALLAEMPADVRVGQLFLITFAGDSAAAESEIADLILNYHVGGVVLLTANDNVASAEDAAAQVARLASDLQSLALAGLPPEAGSPEGAEVQPPPADATAAAAAPGQGVPLFISTVYEGDGPPQTLLWNGVSPLPSAMAIGATWEPEFARAVGEIAGRELAALGVNLLLGPSLDVLEDPRPGSASDLGVRTFGGDPYWVGLMGQAYIDGAHAGSAGRLGLIATHFPGFGSSDRPLNEEVGTVRKSLEQLKQIELAPFFGVTGGATSAQMTADGLLTAHIRYQGFQGNIRATTAPVSFDPQALATLMQLPEFAGWRAAGGLIVSDDLGSRAVQRFYDDTSQDFPHRQIAREALLSGNDLLYLGRFALEGSDRATELNNIKDTIAWFTERYETDQTFRQRVDDAAARILQLKLRLYQGDLSAENVLANPSDLDQRLGGAQDTLFALAHDAVTLIAPGSGDLGQILPPALNDDIVIFTDARPFRQCSSCPEEQWLDPLAMEQRLVALYGPGATSQIQPAQIQSFTFADLEEYLGAEAQGLSPGNAPPTEPAPLETPEGEEPPADETVEPTPTRPTSFFVQAALERAEWVIFAMLQPEAGAEGSDALSLFLARRPDIARSARVIGFAFGAPYYLDTTEVSQLSAYYGLYSKTDPFIDAAVRALFLESPLRGRSPVDIEGVGYDLFVATQPDPAQVLELFIVDEGELKSPPSQEPLEVVPGATLRLQTGVIRDHNGNQVPDGSIVQFVQQDRIQGFVNVIADRPTVGGVANLDYLLEARAGNFRITAVSGSAHSSTEVNIVIGENAVVSVNRPTPLPTVTATATLTPTATATATLTPTATPTLTPPPDETATPDEGQTTRSGGQAGGDGGLMAGFLVGLAATAGAGYALGRNGHQDVSRSVRWSLWGLAGSLLAYNYYALGLGGTEWLEAIGAWAGLLTTLLGGLLGLAAYYLRAELLPQS